MPSTSWNLQQDCARLELGGLAATIDLGCPEAGLTQLCLKGSRLDSAKLLGLVAAASGCRPTATPSERFVRAADLLAVYEESADWPVRIDARWRAGCDDGTQTTLDLMVSVRTSLLDSRPELVIHSVLPADEVLWIAPDQVPQYRPLSLGSESVQRIDAAAGQGCLLFRIAGTEASYAEMVHPLDFRHTLLQREPDTSQVQADHALFAGSLEKGVILRGRIRGLLLPRQEDTERAMRAYRTFAAEEPPLGT